jgi:hypothetical protein
VGGDPDERRLADGKEVQGEPAARVAHRLPALAEDWGVIPGQQLSVALQPELRFALDEHAPLVLLHGVGGLAGEGDPPVGEGDGHPLGDPPDGPAGDLLLERHLRSGHAEDGAETRDDKRSACPSQVHIRGQRK